MKKTKVENISGFRLDFFLRQKKQDVRVVLKPGESSWCDPGSQTKSMILYERKNLIKTSEMAEDTIIDEVAANASHDEVLDDLHTTETVAYEFNEEVVKPASGEEILELSQTKIDSFNPYSELQIPADLSPLDKATQEVEEYKQESEKKPKGKKRGRKKKRGPKPGSKRNKPNNNSSDSTL